MKEDRVKRSSKKAVKGGCESNLEISAGRVRHMFRAEKYSLIVLWCNREDLQ